MSVVDVRPLSSVPAEPWRNGGGVTRTLATNGSVWRVSLAQVERDGPYSRFDGMTRVSFVLRGEGVTLEHGPQVVVLEPLKAIEYDGGKQWNASLIDGPVTALNIMTATGRYRTKVLAISDASLVPPGCAAIVIALERGCRYREPDRGAHGTLEPGQIMVVSNVDVPLCLEPAASSSADSNESAPAVLVRIEPATI